MRQISFFLIVTVVCFYVFRETMYAGIRRNKKGEFYKLSEMLINNNNYNTLILGSSRAESHFIPAIIDSVTQLHSFNAGLAGSTMPFHLAILNAYLENNEPPEKLILQLDVHSFNENNDTIHLYNHLLPFLSNKPLYERLKTWKPEFVFHKWIPFYSIPVWDQRMFSGSIRGWLNMPNSYDLQYNMGFITVSKQKNIDSLMIKDIVLRNPSAIILNAYDSIIRICKEKKIELFVIISPMYKQEVDHMRNLAEIRSIFERPLENTGFRFVDFTSDPICNEKQLFADLNHLKNEGARVFSLKVGQVLTQYIAN